MTGKDVLRSHITRYPAMQVQDLYKLIHQAAMGSEHAIGNPEGARAWLQRELSEMGPGPEEITIDPISADGQIVRVHLRPFIEGGGDPEMLLSGFVRTANEFRGSHDALRTYWKLAKRIQHVSQIEMDRFFERMEAQSFPAVHHSPEYESRYRPAYRVLWRKFIA
jgi:hypothetical protein